MARILANYTCKKQVLSIKKMLCYSVKREQPRLRAVLRVCPRLGGGRGALGAAPGPRPAGRAEALHRPPARVARHTEQRAPRAAQGARSGGGRAAPAPTAARPR